MDKSILRRIEELERQRPSGITVLARNMETGEEREMSIQELAENIGGWDLVKVIDGNDMNGLDALLEAFRKAVDG